jgi:hypothetical protein
MDTPARRAAKKRTPARRGEPRGARRAAALLRAKALEQAAPVNSRAGTGAWRSRKPGAYLRQYQGNIRDHYETARIKANHAWDSAAGAQGSDSSSWGTEAWRERWLLLGLSAKQARSPSARYKAAKAQRTPAWANLRVIKGFAVRAREASRPGRRMVVDHIIPLQGWLVSGLNVPENLQLLTYTHNRVKGNSFCIV